MLLLGKKFLPARLEDLAGKDAKEKFDAATKDLFAELALKAKSNVNKGGDDSKQIQAMSKKKKKKDYRRAKNPKGVGHDKEALTHRETEEQVKLRLL
ncbi:uncharacterized protein LOC131231606 isoform X2 [Magnolia sinica]|uniref:uncharacterized protein LOC131231606 isoform X2 n=1 Tax=Magnolia sinica TaxID=86752 RepID=UPI00265AB82C|nr:uncharacterized protein LOC131231606 isoform X2 [Magnolia sinica]XP_058083844.1 uncharacterized protein LOC131231606 isoform X2 [Magnolia sinica]